MTDAERQQALDAIAAEIAVCTNCRLHETRTRAVPGEGSAETEVVFVGEGPGFNEDRQGRPFVGQAGSLLTDLLSSVGWARDEVFITNVVKCRPPGNRDPEPEEMAACAPYLSRQLEVLDPALVVTLGRFSMGRFMPGARIGQVHGTYRQADAGSGAPNALAFAMYHPAAALHQGALKETLFADMRGVPQALVAARRQQPPRPLPEPAGVVGVDPVTVEVEAVAVEAEVDAVRVDADPVPTEVEAGEVAAAPAEAEVEAVEVEAVEVAAEALPVESEPGAALAEAPAESAEVVRALPADPPGRPQLTSPASDAPPVASPPFPVQAPDEPDPQLTLF